MHFTNHLTRLGSQAEPDTKAWLQLPYPIVKLKETRVKEKKRGRKMEKPRPGNDIVLPLLGLRCNSSLELTRLYPKNLHEWLQPEAGTQIFRERKAYFCPLPFTVRQGLPYRVTSSSLFLGYKYLCIGLTPPSSLSTRCFMVTCEWQKVQHEEEYYSDVLSSSQLKSS